MTTDLRSTGQPLVVVFSKDRALQLHGLLTSMNLLVDGEPPMQILYRASSADHDDAYTDLRREFETPRVCFVPEVAGRFRSQVRRIVRGAKTRTCLFLVDDMIFTEPVDLANFASMASRRSVPSLRLGRNLSFAYTVQRPQPLPDFRSAGTPPTPRDGFPDLEWTWDEGTFDWAYPLSLDGNVFPRQWLLAMMTVTPFHSPNSLESRLQRLRPLYRGSTGVCREKSCVVNLAINRVQDEFENLHGDSHQDELLNLWQEGFRIDVGALTGLSNASVHEDLPLPLRRITGPTSRPEAADG